MRKATLFTTLFIMLTGLISPVLAQNKILIVVTNNKEVNASINGKDTLVAGGYELSEVSEAYKVFSESGFEVDFMSPKGGMTYAESKSKMLDVDKAFLADKESQSKLRNTLSPADVNAKDYVAIYFAGGKTMWDFPNNKAMAKLTAEIYETKGVVGAVCHGPAALVNVTLSDGSSLVSGKAISSFTDLEERLFSKSSKYLPFMLQEKLTSLGANFKEAPAMFDQAVVDQRLVTGQNPNSTYSVAEEMVRQLGVEPPTRPWTNMSYTLGVIKVLVIENKRKAAQFYKAHSGTNQLEEALFLNYSMYAFKGHLGKLAKSKGLELFEFGVYAFPNSAKSHEALAEAYHQLGKEKEAITAINKSLSIAPDSKTAQKLKREIEVN